MRFEPVDPDLYLDTRAEVVENRHQSIGRKPRKVAVSDPRKVGRGETGSRLGGPDAQLLPVERLDDFGRQERLQLVDIRILAAQIAENVTAPAYQLQFFPFHR